MSLDWRFHHIGIAVRDIVVARDVYAQLGFDCSEIMLNPTQNVQLVFCRGSGPTVELVAPVDERSPCISYLKRVGPGPYHTCYYCDDLEKSLEQLKQMGIKYKVIAKPQPETPSGQIRLMFLLIPACGLIELIETRCSPQETGKGHKTSS